MIEETTNGTDRVARWRERHPDKNRSRRDKDNENRRTKRKINKSNGKDPDSGLKCSRSNCNKPGEVHHAGGKRIVLCRDHHYAAHKRRGDGMGSAGGHNENIYLDDFELIHEGFFDSIKGVFSPKYKLIFNLDKVGKKVDEIKDFFNEMGEEYVGRRRLSYLLKLLDGVDHEIDSIVDSIRRGKKLKRIKHVHVDDLY